MTAIRKVLIDNRGEIALRILRTCRKLGVGAVIAYSARDAESLPVREALELGQDDERYGAVLVGGDTADTSYDDSAGVIVAAKAYGCDAVHPGYGFLSERADAAEAVAAAGLIFIGPPADVIRQVGNKSAARALAERCAVPVMPASKLLHRYAEAVEAVAAIGFPVVLKADIGGGGMNNLFVETAPELEEKFENFSLRNPGGFYVEKKLDHARHIELQVAADTHGSVVVLGERDCTAQRKAQKVIEEAPVLIAPEAVLKNMRESAIKMAKTVEYTGVGTWEFLFDPATNDFYFMEINPRVQVEHTVTEECYDNLDIVAWQLAIAAGDPLPEVPKRRSNHVIQLRLYAEDPRNDFRPCPGILELLRFPETDASLRIDRGYDEGDPLPAGFDTTIAKIIVNGATREEARLRALEALETTLVSGVTTNRDFLRWLLNTPEFTENTIWTTFIEPAWQAEQRNRFRDTKRFFAEGNFAEHAMPASFVVSDYLQDISYTRRGAERRYSEDLERQHDNNPSSCGFRYGIFTAQDGTKMAVGYWDFSVMGGTLGSEEGAAVAALFELAHSEKLPVVTITASSGARQQEGAKALEMMDVMMAARWKCAPPLFVNVYSGMNFGGVTVSLAESADISIAVSGSQIGFAGPDLVARMMGKQNGRDLETGAHSAEDAYANRSIDLLVEDLAEARDRIVQLCGVLSGKADSAYSHPSYLAVVPTRRYDRAPSERFGTLIADLAGRVDPVRFPDKATGGTVTEIRKRLSDPARLTAADFLDDTFGLFDSAAPLSLRQIKETAEEYPPVIGALVVFEGQPLLVLGQQTQRRHTSEGMLEKVYVAPRARDFRWALRKVELAQRLSLPVVLFCDTTGGDASLSEEAEGVSRAISDFLSIFYKPGGADVPTISITIGENGSGGGLTFGRPLDAAADLENALTFVATPDAQVKILTDTWPENEAASAAIVNQLQDATAVGRRKLGQIDTVIPEGDSATTAKAIHSFLASQLPTLLALTPEERLNRRFDRIAEAGTFGLHKNN